MSKRNDISQQIRKYLNGELDARAMHQLEKEAQNDPFLMEALEGYEKTGIDQQSNIDDIHARLKARINKKEARIIPWRIISIAASILIALTIGGLWLKNNKPEMAHKQIAIANTIRAIKPNEKPVEIAKVMPPPLYTPEHTLSHTTQQKHPEAIVANTQPAEEYKAVPTPANGYLAETTPVKKNVLVDTVKLAEVNVVGYAAQRKNSVAASVQSISPGILDKGISPVTNKLEGKVTGIMISKTKNKAITGIVKDESGQPIPGASIRIKGTAISTQTNLSGYFKLDSVPNKSTLSVNFIGYEKKEVAVTKRDSLVIAMQPSSRALSEVVVVGYGTQKEQEYQPAQPAAGWDDYKKYLKDNAKSPDGKTGTVKLSFIVNTDNSLSDFKIIKSVSAKTDSAAIDLVTNGPDWQKSNTVKAEKVKLRIKFTGK